MKVGTRGGEGINWLARQVAVPWGGKRLPTTVVQYHKAALFISHDQHVPLTTPCTASSVGNHENAAGQTH